MPLTEYVLRFRTPYTPHTLLMPRMRPREVLFRGFVASELGA